ncbi:FAD:protein FMN transferase [Limosilactobacillus fermentum]|uniref:FAD:protein FMN transferase n=1 Tax=Limosilactobacillus fermentum TaxID=1613 RepID=UPI0027E9AC3E|nr:FAD:protein FMN transferase [Limosilactobacillus fermentum]MDQ7190523.1 FAD:protein FMN transferase [Limosilactobacillus fermentum]
MQAGRTVHLMGTVITLVINGGPNAGTLADQVVEQLRAAEHRFSANDGSADLMKINASAGQGPVEAAPDLYQLIKLGVHYSKYPGGNLNVAIGPLVKLWHIGFQDARVPSQAEIDRALALTDPRQITLDDVTHSVSLNRPGMEIDLGALAKGFIGDQVIAWLKEQGVESALLNLGGSTVIGLGGNPENEDGMWHVGIQNPADPAQAYGQVVSIKDQALTTSGVAERKLTTNGKTYHHILNPQTGYPDETTVVSMSLVTPTAFLGELWTTMLFGKTKEQIAAVVKTLEQTVGVLIEDDGTVIQLR